MYAMTNPIQRCAWVTLGAGAASVPGSLAEGVLGTDVFKTFGARLPFLLKVLAIEAPLSLQVHPNPRQAAAGFAEDQARGLPLNAPERRY